MEGWEQPERIGKQKSLYSKSHHLIPKATSDDVDAAYRAAALAKQEWDKVNPFKSGPFWKKPFLSLKSTKKRLFT